LGRNKHFRMVLYCSRKEKHILGWCNGDILRGIKTLMLQFIEFNIVENILGWFCIRAENAFSDGVILQ
jgi:hypothetical protein